MSKCFRDIDLYERYGEGAKDYEPEPQICSTFGCGKKLSVHEKLFGDKCINCNTCNKKKSPIQQQILISANKKYNET